jgi:hypothetical protein
MEKYGMCQTIDNDYLKWKEGILAWKEEGNSFLTSDMLYCLNLL